MDLTEDMIDRGVASEADASNHVWDKEGLVTEEREIYKSASRCAILDRIV